MKFFFLSLISFFFFVDLFSQDSLVQGSQLYYQIAPIYNFRKNVLSFTFDDGAISQFTIGMPILNERKIPASFYIITGKVDKPLKQMLFLARENLHEIGSHTFDHKNLTMISTDSVNIEFSKSKLWLDNLFPSYECLTLAYPFGGFNIYVQQIAQKYYFACRSTLNGYNFLDSLDRYALKIKNFSSDVSLKSANQWYDHSLQEGSWLIEVIHGFSGNGYKPIDPNIFKRHLDYVKSNENLTWFATVSNVIKYVDESKNTKLFCSLCVDSIYKIRLVNDLNNPVYNQPLSIKLKIPDIWDSIYMSGATFVDLKIEDGNKFLFFNAIPDNREVLIKPKSYKKGGNTPSINFIYSYPNPFADYIDIYYESKNESNVTILLENLRGDVLLRRQQIAVEPINYVRLETRNISKGFYILELIEESCNQKVSRKMTKIY